MAKLSLSTQLSGTTLVPALKDPPPLPDQVKLTFVASALLISRLSYCV